MSFDNFKSKTAEDLIQIKEAIHLLKQAIIMLGDGMNNLRKASALVQAEESDKAQYLSERFSKLESRLDEKPNKRFFYWLFSLFAGTLLWRLW